MLTSLAVAAALTLAPAQTGTLKLTNERLTYGTLGPTRTDGKFLPGDIFSMTFDIEGLKPLAGGKVSYSLGFQVTDAKGKLFYGEDPRDLETILHLGGNKVPASPFVVLPTDMAAGTYEFKMTVKDRVGNASQTLTKKFEVLPRAFGLVALQISNGQIQTPPLGVAGQDLFIHFVVVGFERDKAKKQPNVLLEMSILDANKKPTLDQPVTGNFGETIGENHVAVPTYFLLKLNRTGNYTVQLKATDQVTKKTATLTIPMRVLE
jgi:hypothetical protein